jgi:TonB family protein
MRQTILALEFLALTSIVSLAQSPLAPIWQVHQAPDTDGVYYVGPEVSAPRLIKTVYVPYPAASAKQTDGMTALSMVIDANGLPQHIQILHSHGDQFDQLSFAAVQQSSFAPGMLAGKPVPVWIDILVAFYSNHSQTSPRILVAERDLPAPPESAFEDKHHKPLASTPPIPIHTVDADFTDPFTKHPLVMVATVTAFVGADGLPKNVHIRRGLGFGLDQKATAAVQHYRFIPATRRGKPAEGYCDLQVNFVKF